MEKSMKNEITKTMMKDIIEWDVVNWSKAIPFWEKEGIDYAGKKVLEIGSHNGGLSLYFALMGADVVCSDLTFPTEKAKEIHQKYGVFEKITYKAIDATDIKYDEYFDIICFKSVLGGIGYHNSKDRQQFAINQMHKALKPQGHLLFAENLTASAAHKFLRKKFIPWGNNWRYVTIDELKEMLRDFQSITYTSVGFLGAFGRNNRQRNALGYIDQAAELVIPKKNRYIGVFLAKK